MDTATISYRVADFLKKHPPFHAMEEHDLLDLAARGRVRFHERNEYIVWQGEPHKLQVFVIQQGTVSLWDEHGEPAELRDVLGPGDMLGIERYTGARSCLYSARSASDVVIYAFPAADFEALLAKYPHAVRYVAAHGGVTIDYESGSERRQPHNVFLHDVVKEKQQLCCGPEETVRDAARRLQSAGGGAIAVVDANGRTLGALTPAWFVDRIAKGDGHFDQPIANLLQHTLPALAADASVADGVLTMGAAQAAELAVTDDGAPGGRLHALVTVADLLPVFGDQPAAVLAEIRRASDTRELRRLNQRARALILHQLTGAASADWLGRFAHLVDAAIVNRIVALNSQPCDDCCWCFSGAAARKESLTRIEPRVVLLLEGDQARSAAVCSHVLASLAECDYLPRPRDAFEPPFYAASVAEWKTRYQQWIRDPVLQQTYRARSLFDLQPISGRQALWQDIERTIDDTVDGDFLRLLASDCLASLPPLTFFQDAVVEESGDHTAVFRLKHSALQPLVDVGRVFGLAARRRLGSSTRERFSMARELLPTHEAIFREAADTLSVVLWQQGRVGISQGTGGFELPPTVLSRHDRHVLKGGFRSILRLLEFTADWGWLEAL